MQTISWKEYQEYMKDKMNLRKFTYFAKYVYFIFLIFDEWFPKPACHYPPLYFFNCYFYEHHLGYKHFG